ncbi:hypothetical protein HYPBUDRAFT_111319, partial [Hyphopichia burtonii NRRL Y-1933]
SVTFFLNSPLSNEFFSVKPVIYSTNTSASEIELIGVFSCKTFSNADIKSPFLFSVLYASSKTGYFSSYLANFFIFALTGPGKVLISIPARI